jgi:hypothetical protein
MSPRLTSFLAWRRSSIFGLVILPVFLVASAIAVLERRLTDYRLKETVQVESLHDINLTLRNLAVAIESSDSLAAAQRFVAAAARQKGVHALVLADVESLTIFASSNLEELGRDLSLSSDRAAAEALRDFARTRTVSHHRDDKAVGAVFPVRLSWKKAERRGLAAEGVIYLRTDDVDRLISGSVHLGYWLDLVSAARVVLIYALALWLVRRHVLAVARRPACRTWAAANWARWPGCSTKPSISSRRPTSRCSPWRPSPPSASIGSTHGTSVSG